MVQRANISTQVLFDFDRATIRPDGGSALDDVAARARGVTIEVVIVTGHADRIGGDAYNQRLSGRRAEAVKAYLVSKGMQPGRIYAEGKGEMQSLTGDKCRNMGAENRRNRKLIACLQPDRRVEIELLGTRSQ
jgi:OOP family OmpA-OmpF porin